MSEVPFELQPGRIYALHVPYHLSEETARQMSEVWKTVKTSSKLIVLDNGMKLEEVDPALLRQLVVLEQNGADAS